MTNDRSTAVRLPRPKYVPEPPERPFVWPKDPANDLVESAAQGAIWREGDWFIKMHWNGLDIVAELYHDSWRPCSRVWVNHWRNPWEWLLRLTRQQRVERAIEHLKRKARYRQALWDSIDLRTVDAQQGEGTRLRDGLRDLHK